MINPPDRPQVVVITGASAGIGRAAARAFARDGARIGLLARGRDALVATQREVESLGGFARVVPCDVADPAQVEVAAKTVESELGPIEIWVNNAMASVFSPIKDTTPEEFRRVTEVTYLGYVYGTLAALRRMLPRNRGVIVQVSSALAFRGIPLQAAYCAAKHAIDGFCDSLRCELRHDGSAVRVTMVHLSAFNTPQFGWVKSRLPRQAKPVPPIFQPEIAANAIVFAAQHPRRQFVVGWPALKAILAQKFVPGVADRVLARQGYDGQQTGQAEDPHRPHNLWQPLPGEHRAHGRFDREARRSSWQWTLSKHRGLVAAGMVVACMAVAGRVGRR
jgi:NAD(P)-dependent dehydrogenase (short-subunit alcohol dehydrogenase family)